MTNRTEILWPRFRNRTAQIQQSPLDRKHFHHISISNHKNTIAFSNLKPISHLSGDCNLATLANFHCGHL